MDRRQLSLTGPRYMLADDTVDASWTAVLRETMVDLLSEFHSIGSR